MNEDAAVQAVKTVIYNARATLVLNLSANGVPKEILFLSDSPIASLDQFIAVSVRCDRASEYQHPEFMNSTKATPYETEYQMVVDIVDAGSVESGETIYGSTAYTTFRDFCDRLVKLLRRDTDWFPSSSGTPRFRLQTNTARGREIQKENINPLEVEGGFLMGSELTFKIVGCNDGD